jgi:hypothetical protein
MSSAVPLPSDKLRIRLSVVLVGVLALWLAYTAIYTLPIPEVPASILHLLPGIAAVSILRRAGFSWRECYLRANPISAKGVATLCLVTVAIAGPLLTSAHVGFRLLAVLLLAPASAAAQELFFRSALLPTFLRALPGRPAMANSLQAILFALWHVPKAFIYSPIDPFLGALMLGSVTLLGGFGWGWQVRQDETIVWSTAHHWLLLSIMSLFGV